jgi:rubredoxin
MSAPAIVICQCCEYQFDPNVEECYQDIDVGYVCKDCSIQLKWAFAHLKVNGLKQCTKVFNHRLK